MLMREVVPVGTSGLAPPGSCSRPRPGCRGRWSVCRWCWVHEACRTGVVPAAMAGSQATWRVTATWIQRSRAAAQAVRACGRASRLSFAGGQVREPGGHHRVVRGLALERAGGVVAWAQPGVLDQGPWGGEPAGESGHDGTGLAGDGIGHGIDAFRLGGGRRAGRPAGDGGQQAPKRDR
jgi:hypothetical protein